MDRQDWDRVWSRNLLAPFEREDNRRNLKHRSRYVDWVETLLDGDDCRRGTTLELGCGTGLDTIGLHDRLGFTSGMLVDYSPGAIEIARLNAVGRDIEVRQADLLDFATERRFDLVFSVGLVEHFRGAALRTIVARHAAFLEPHGRVVILAPRKGLLWPFLWTLNRLTGIREDPPRESDLTALCEDFGLRVRRSRHFLAGMILGLCLEPQQPVSRST